MTITITDGAVTRRSLSLSILGRGRATLHFQRKFYHLIMGLGCFCAYAFFLDRLSALLLLGLMGGTLVACDVMRFKIPALRRYAVSLFGNVMRREELRSLSGNSFYVFGLFLIVIFFPKDLVLLSILFLAVGDPAAALVGTAFGRHRLFGKKSLEGALANFAASLTVALLFGMFYLGLAFPRSLTLAFIGALVSVISELLPTRLDDNFTIPVLSCSLLYLVCLFFPIL